MNNSEAALILYQHYFSANELYSAKDRKGY